MLQNRAIADLDHFFVFIFITKNIFDLNRVRTLGPKRLKWRYSGCSFIPLMNLYSSKQRHNNLIVIIIQISNLSKYTNKVESSLEPPFPTRSQKHRNMIENTVNLFFPCFFVFSEEFFYMTEKIPPYSYI